ncbi:MAG: hypothetical protein NTX12_06900 [Actinobacteria bacterium]|nr:hypothetical protein [Actinomycetota bacterium]
MKLIAITLVGLFLAVTVAPADASTRRLSTSRSTSVHQALIPGAQGCCG